MPLAAPPITAKILHHNFRKISNKLYSSNENNVAITEIECFYKESNVCFSLLIVHNGYVN